MEWPTSLQLIGSKELGGAERWFQRFAVALATEQAPAVLGVRRGSALERLDYAGLSLARLPFLSVWDPLSRAAIKRLVGRECPQIVQTYMGRATRLTRLGRLQRGGAVHIARLGGYYKLSPYRHAHGWVGNTRGLCDWMIGQGLPVAQVHHLYNFAEPVCPHPPAAIEHLRHSLGLGDAWVLLALGRFVPVKGQSYLLQALSRLPAEIDQRPWVLLLVGDGPLRASLQQQAQDSGLSQRLRWCGWQADPGPYLQLADLVVFPSLEQETLGNVILEAWAWRRPLLSASFRGARELIRPGEDALTVPCADAPALSVAIRQLLGDAHLRHELVERGARRVREEFSQAVIMQQYRDLYVSLLEAPSWP
ncbi:glycosyltransferase [Thiorhodovibrio frisius]|uniref:Glycosyltransferase n=1 Tax=Thiorhodovibrio frisius TaxID=631362 RepID=H8Z4N0_9GAMM|nr:glycosyltransferase [Thiorhodovibrio frisius]EIC20287.1 glycosyltransferase [Thiorhodovibrio frisius]WPL21024.1 Glycosyltransferase KanE [Thiorhodovibrio frisius]